MLLFFFHIHLAELMRTIVVTEW